MAPRASRPVLAVTTSYPSSVSSSLSRDKMLASSSTTRIRAAVLVILRFPSPCGDNPAGSISLRIVSSKREGQPNGAACIGAWKAEVRVILTCPICRAPLSESGRTLRCPRGHAYDVTREGYVNLLARQRPGDTREMLTARRRFLERGHYGALSDAL